MQLKAISPAPGRRPVQTGAPAILLILVLSQVSPAAALGAGGPPVDVGKLGGELAITPGGGVDVSAKIAHALKAGFTKLYFPPGEYRLDQAVLLPGNCSITGAGIGQTIFTIGTTADTIAFRVHNQSNVVLSNFTIDRVNKSACKQDKNPNPLYYSKQQAVYVVDSNHVRLERIAVTHQYSRAPALSFLRSDDCAARHCQTSDNLMVYWTPPVPVARNNPRNAWHVYGSGITFHGCKRPVVEYNIVDETVGYKLGTDDPITTAWRWNQAEADVKCHTYRRYVQASTLQVVVCTDALIQYNQLYFTGQGIDSNGTKGALVRGNYIENCHQHGLKIAHSARNQQFIGNYIKCAALKGIAFAPGKDDQTFNCTAEDNTFVDTGRFLGSTQHGKDFWNPSGEADYPACVFMDRAASPKHNATGNKIRGNKSYHNDALTTAAANPVVEIRDLNGVHGAHFNAGDIVDNIAETGNPKTKAEFIGAFPPDALQ